MNPKKLPADLKAYLRAGSPEEQAALAIDYERLPRHVAIIMDGNGRWATMRHLPRVAGHRAGIDAVRDVVEASARLGLEVLTLYAFSQENWKRPRAEVATLMSLLKEYVRREQETLVSNNIRFSVIGRVDELSPSVRAHLRRAMEATSRCTGLLFIIALSYGGRAEIVDACRGVLRRAREEGMQPEEITEDLLAEHLYTAGQPDPDLLIRTSGELRVSNFLLWQIAYAEIWVTQTLWPDFRCHELFQAIVDYQKRERRYGGVVTVKRRVV